MPTPFFVGSNVFSEGSIVVTTLGGGVSYVVEAWEPKRTTREIQQKDQYGDWYAQQNRMEPTKGQCVFQLSGANGMPTIGDHFSAPNGADGTSGQTGTMVQFTILDVGLVNRQNTPWTAEVTYQANVLPTT